MDMKKNLQELGFSANDADLYLALIKVGESSVGAIIKQTGMHREMVYGGLKRLELQGFIQSLEKKKIRHYQALDPSVLVKRMQEKAALAVSALPYLNQMLLKVPVTVRIFEGPEGFEEIQKDIQAS